MTRRRKKHRPDEIVAKLRDADAMLHAGKDLAAVLQALEVSDSTLERRRAQYDETTATSARSVQRRPDLHPHLPVGDLAVLDVPSGFQHLEPAQVFFIDGGFRHGVLHGFFNADVG
jgi:putative transposase